MAPEQARGEPVDARADVFALGSILAAILTGKPAFAGTTMHETIAKAAGADLGDVQERLAKCGADVELVQLALKCLAARPEDRFADGREVASAVAAYRAAVEARLRRAETAAAEAMVREAEQRKRRRLAIVAGSSIAAVLLVGLAVSLWQMNRAMRAEAIAVENERQAVANAELARSNEAKPWSSATPRTRPSRRRKWLGNEPWKRCGR
jgi:serine/threonine protein kinase